MKLRLTLKKARDSGPVFRVLLLAALFLALELFLVVVGLILQATTR